MTKPDDDYVLINSSLSGEFRRDGVSVEVQIYRGEDDNFWILEVVDQAGNSYLWEEQFTSDELAMKEFVTSVEKGGIKQYNPYFKQRVH